MAHLLRPWQVRYVDAEGRRVPKGTPKAKKVRQRARKWYGAGIPGKDAEGKPYGTRRIALASDKAVARQMLADLVRRSERREVGFEDKTTEAASTPLADHLADFESWMRSRSGDVSEKQVQQTLHRVRTVFDACSFQFPGDIDADDVAEYLADRRRLPRRSGGLSIQTSNHYATAVSTFCRWMCEPRRRRMSGNPMEGMERGNVKLDRRHDRRALMDDELARLYAATLASDRTICTLSPEDRHWLYRIAAGTGFRRAELASLTPESFSLDGHSPTILVDASYAKNRKTARQPVSTGLADALASWVAGKSPDLPLWPGQIWCNQTAPMFRKDLEAAGIPYEVKGAAGSQFADFHSLRHTYITLLAKRGVHPKEAQALARHSTIGLTMDRYTHANDASLAAAVSRLDAPADGTMTPAQVAAAMILFRTVLQTLLG
jgi:integrase